MFTQKEIQRFQVHIPYQMRPYPSSKLICRLNHTCFRVFEALGQLGETRSIYFKSWTWLHRIIKSPRLDISQLKRS